MECEHESMREKGGAVQDRPSEEHSFSSAIRRRTPEEKSLCLCCIASFAIAAPEPFYPATSVNDPLFACIEGVTLRADVKVD